MNDLILPATTADLPTLVQLETECFSDPWTESALLTHINGSVNRTLLYYKEGVCVGALLLQCILPEFEVLRIETHPSQRRKGVAQKLLSHAHAQLREEGYTKGFLEVRLRNEPAKALYTAMGYLPYGKRPNYYQHPTDDGLLMQVTLL